MSHSIFQYGAILLAVLIIFSVQINGQNQVISSENRPFILQNWQITKDVSPKEILKNIPDSLWQPFNQNSENVHYSVGNWIIETKIIVKDSLNKNTVWGLFPLELLTAYEIYWDGLKIGENGVIGNDKSDEKAGTSNYTLLLSLNLLSAGEHSIILRLSNYSSYPVWKWYYGELLICPYDRGLKAISRTSYQAYFIIGFLCIPFLFNLFLFIARKRRTEHLLFSLICILVILDSTLVVIPTYFITPTTYIYLAMYAFQVITVLFSILFPTFFIYMFLLSKKAIGALVGLNIIILLFFTNYSNFFNIMSLVVLAESSIITGWALFTRREGSINITIGLIIAWVAYFINIAFTGLATIMVICTSYSIARQFARKEKEERDAQLRSAHLENELLKKNINPHFLLNSLTSIIVWLRKDPKSAIKLIETLAEEFRMVTQISPLRQIPIMQEIDLCRMHLTIMNYRKGAKFELTCENIIENENIPPMILHTLVENGLTHGYENKDIGTFTLVCKKNSDCIQYILYNDGDFSGGETPDSSGFGMRYIKGRLEESYPERWGIVSRKKENGWETIIEIKDK